MLLIDDRKKFMSIIRTLLRLVAAGRARLGTGDNGQCMVPMSRKHSIGRHCNEFPSMSSSTPPTASEVTPLHPKRNGGANNSTTVAADLESGRGSSPGKGAYQDAIPTWDEVMAKIVPFLKPADTKHLLCAIAALISVIVGKIIGILPPLAIKYAVDAIASNVDNPDASLRPILCAIGAYFGLKLLGMINAAGQDLAQRTVALDAERRFAVETFAHLHHLSLSYHLEKHIGEITRIMNRGSDSVSTVISSFLFYVAPTVFEFMVVSAVFWKLGTPAVALSTFVAVVLFLAFTIFVTKTRIAFRRKLIEANDAVGQKETETLVHYETVSIFGRTEEEIEKYGALRQTYKDRRVEMLSMFALLELGQKLIRLGGVTAGLVIAALATVYGYGPNEEKLSPGSFVVIQMYIDQLFNPLSQLGWQYRMITQAFTDLEKAVTMLNRVPDVQDAPNATEWKPSTNGEASGDIELRNVSFRYKIESRQRPIGTALNGSSLGGGAGRHGMRRGRLAMGLVDEGVNKKNDSPTNKTPKAHVQLGGVSNIDLHIPAGKTVALVGRSGSGKTTLFRLILRLYDTDAGRIFVDGLDVKALKQQSLRRNIGVVSQETILFNASLRDNITYGREHATEEEIWRAVKASALQTFVENCPDGLETIVGERGMKLSGGERQRVGLARCIIKEPRLVLLDEATSSLDSTTERDIQRNIAEICKGRTTVMICHRLSTARHADEIVVLERGSIIERGSHEELIERNGQYADMWRIQIDAGDQDAND